MQSIQKFIKEHFTNYTAMNRWEKLIHFWKSTSSSASVTLLLTRIIVMQWDHTHLVIHKKTAPHHQELLQMFLTPKITTNSPYFHSGSQTQSLKASTVVTHQPAQYTVRQECVWEHTKETGLVCSKQDVREGKLLYRGRATLPDNLTGFVCWRASGVKELSGWGKASWNRGFSSANDGTVKLHQTGWSIVFLECKPLFIYSLYFTCYSL